MKRLAIVIILSSQLTVAVSLRVQASEGTTTPVIPTATGGGNGLTVTGGGSGVTVDTGKEDGLTFDGVLKTINDSLDTVDEFLEEGNDSISGYLGQVAGLVGELFGDDTGTEFSKFFKDVAKVVNLINRVANAPAKIGSFWQDFYQTALGAFGEAKECISSPITINGSQFIDYDPSTWCFGLLTGSGDGDGGDGGGDGDGGDGGGDGDGGDGDGGDGGGDGDGGDGGGDGDGDEIIEAPTYPSEIFIPDDSSEDGSDGGDPSQPKSVPELMALAAQGTVTGIPDLDELRQIANEVNLKNTDAFETIDPVRTYHTIDMVENSILRKIGTQPLSKAGQKQIKDSVQATQQMMVQSSQIAASAQGKKITQGVMKDLTRIQATQSTILGSIASDTATNRFQSAATNVTLSNISRQLAEQQKYERSEKGILAQQLLFKGFSSDLK